MKPSLQGKNTETEGEKEERIAKYNSAGPEQHLRGGGEERRGEERRGEERRGEEKKEVDDGEEKGSAKTNRWRSILSSEAKLN